MWPDRDSGCVVGVLYYGDLCVLRWWLLSFWLFGWFVCDEFCQWFVCCQKNDVLLCRWCHGLRAVFFNPVCQFGSVWSGGRISRHVLYPTQIYSQSAVTCGCTQVKRSHFGRNAQSTSGEYRTWLWQSLCSAKPKQRQSKAELTVRAVHAGLWRQFPALITNTCKWKGWPPFL